MHAIVKHDNNVASRQLNKELFPSMVIIQPNYKAFSEVWLARMTGYFGNSIKGMAAFLPQGKTISEKFPFFDLYGRKPNFQERQLLRLKVFTFDGMKIRDSELKNFVCSKRPEIVLVHFLTTAVHVMKALRTLKMPIFIHVHGMDILWDLKKEDDVKVKYHSKEYVENVKDIMNWPNVKFIANSNFSESQLEKVGVPADKVSLKYFGVAVHPINRNYGKKKLTVLFLGRFVDFKGPDIVLMAFLEACEKGFEGELVMAGDGPLKNMCEILAFRSAYKNLISFTGVVSEDEATQLYRNADIYSMHNYIGPVSGSVEAFGVSIIEAMSYGLPVITGKSAGPLEIITHQQDGFLIEPGNISSHADIFLLLYKDRDTLKRVSENAAKTIKSRFSPEQEKNALQKILSQ